jgi:hypothetical protein
LQGIDKKSQKEFGEGRFLMIVEKWLQIKGKERMADLLRKTWIKITNHLQKKVSQKFKSLQSIKIYHSKFKNSTTDSHSFYLFCPIYPFSFVNYTIK